MGEVEREAVGMGRVEVGVGVEAGAVVGVEW